MLLIFTIAAFLIMTGVALSGYFFLTADSPVEQRLRSVVPEPKGQPQVAAPRREGPAPLARMIAFVGGLSAGNNETSLTQLLSTAGYRSPNALFLFVGARTIISLLPALAYLVPRVSRGEPLGRTLFIALLLWWLVHMLTMLWLRRRARHRMFKIQTALPDSLDLMVVCLEAGLGLTATISRVGEERSALDDPLGLEFSYVARELREGRAREDSLRAMGERNGVEDLKALVGLIVQSDRLGASMAKTLRSHADVLRTKRRQRAEEAARKLPIKILFPLAFFILPALFVVTIGPSILRIGDLINIVSQRGQ
jgi:tight adherence protein C